jgi:hypothetical protein
VEQFGTDPLDVRDNGLRRVGRITRWATAGSAAALVVTAAVLAGGEAAAASVPQVSPGPATVGTPAPSTAPRAAPRTQSLQPPATAPQPSHGGRSHTSSGSS